MQRILTQRTICVSLFTLVAATGCSQSLQSDVSVSYQRQRLRTTDYQAVLDAAQRTVREGFTISDSDHDSGIIRGEQRRTDGTSSRTTQVGSPLRTRKIAEVRVVQHDSDVEVLCRVFVQENTTDAVRMLTREHRGYDQAYNTPAERDAGTTRDQNTVWRNRGRDRVTERQILASIREIVENPAQKP